MPELPEVETVVRAIRPYLTGKAILDIQTYISRLRTPLSFTNRSVFCNQKIRAVRRRAKYILLELANNQVVVFHLGMTGSLRLEPPHKSRMKHDHLQITLNNGQSLRFNDPRRFGLAELHTIPKPKTDPAFLKKLGPEPLSDHFSIKYLSETCKKHTKPIKNLLMDQNLVVGVGNIYANEALFRARIRPTYPAQRLALKRISRLHEKIIQVLQEAINTGGTTISDFKTPDGKEGLFYRQLQVYNKENETCSQCRQGVIKRIILGGRSTFYCSQCQR